VSEATATTVDPPPTQSNPLSKHRHNRGALALWDSVGRSIGLLSQGLLMFGLHQKGLWAWRVYNAFGAYCAMFLLCVLVFGGFIDTPASLAQRGRLEDARQALRTLRNPLYAAQVWVRTVVGGGCGAGLV